MKAKSVKLTKDYYLNSLVQNCSESIVRYELELATEKSRGFILYLERVIFEAKIRLKYYEYAVRFSANHMVSMIESEIEPTAGSMCSATKVATHNYLAKELNKFRGIAEFANKLEKNETK